MIEIRLNPYLEILSKSKNCIQLVIDRNQLNLSGPRIQNFFIPLFDYLFTPLRLDDAINIIESNKNYKINKDDFYQLVYYLISRNILVFQSLNTDYLKNLTTKEVKILLLDYTNLNMGDCIKKDFISLLKEDDIYFDIVSRKSTIKDKNIYKFIKENKFDLIVTIFWEFVPQILEELYSQSIGCILPVVSNLNYFSIGPHITSIWTKKNAIFSLESEITRYLYLNHEINCSGFSIFYGHVAIEIKELIKYLYFKDSSNNCRTIKDMITFNYNSFELALKRYRIV